MKFSLVCPIKDEANLIPYTLPSFYALNPSEVILCLDDPAPQNVVEAIERVARAHNEVATKIIEVAPNSEYTYQQAWIRRRGFMEAEHDRILNTDIDLVLTKNVLKAVERVGKNNIGLAAMAKINANNNIGNRLHRLQLLVRFHFLHKNSRILFTGLRTRVFFTGLYALWRPYWLDSEPLDKIKRFIGVKQVWRGEYQDVNGVPKGEDSHLKSCMLRKHRCIFISDVGGRIVRENPEYLRWLYRTYGRHAGLNGGGFVGAVVHTLLKHHSDYLRGYLEAKHEQD